MRLVSFALSLLLACLLINTAAAQTAYQKPPKAILDVLNAPSSPTVSLSPTRDQMMLVERERYPSIVQLSQPMLRLAGFRFNPATNGPHGVTRITKLTLKNVNDGKETTIAVPAATHFGTPEWSPDGKQFALTNTLATGIELWIGNAATGKLRRVPAIQINNAFGGGFGGSDAVQWMPDSQTLLCKAIPANRGAAPAASTVPAGPTIQENYGKVTPAVTYQDLLKNAHDEKLYEYYATSQLAFINTASGKVTPIGKPAIYSGVDIAPDGNHLLITTTHRPYSYLHTAGSFPHEYEVWNLSGKLIHKVASTPLRDQLTIESVPTGPRSISWRATDAATLVWVEALDGGETKKPAVLRDRVVMLKAPFSGQPVELAKTEFRFAGLMWLEKGGQAFLRDSDRVSRKVRTFLLNADNLQQPARLIWNRSAQDRYNDPGSPVMKRLPNGQSVVRQHGDNIFLDGNGASPQGDRPFLDKFNLATLKAERLWRSDENSYETVTSLMSDDGSKFMTRYETATTPPNFFLRSASDKKALTNFSDPTPQIRGIKKQLVTYKRKDGVPLSFTLYLPPNYQKGTTLPTVIWAYPREFNDADTAGQVSGSPHRFTTISGMSHLFFLLQGYAVLDDASMPVVGDVETMNNSYIEQVVASAEAAIDKAVEMGVTDRNRVGVGGHSYGAFMTANLLAHSDIFKAGIARSGAYNRTLTPFGFQSERRSFWEAEEMYYRVSPFMYADKLKEPILLMHGEADNNTGTHPIQSDRFYQALKGNGATVRYVTLPHESHGYAARESIEHTLWEMLTWFDKHVAGANSTASR